MDSQTMCFVAVGMLLVIFVASFFDNQSRRKEDSLSKNNKVFNKENFESADKSDKETLQKLPASNADAVFYFSREDVARLLEIFEEIRRNVDDKDAEEISFDVCFNGRRISVVIGGNSEGEDRKEEEK